MSEDDESFSELLYDLKHASPASFGTRLIKVVEAIDERLTNIEARLSPLEAHKEAADDVAEAATHRPSCKCGYFGHG